MFFTKDFFEDRIINLTVLATLSLMALVSSFLINTLCLVMVLSPTAVLTIQFVSVSIWFHNVQFVSIHSAGICYLHKTIHNIQINWVLHDDWWLVKKSNRNHLGRLLFLLFDFFYS